MCLWNYNNKFFYIPIYITSISLILLMSFLLKLSFGYDSILVILESVSFFLIFINVNIMHNKITNFLYSLGGMSLYFYLTDCILIDNLNLFLINKIEINIAFKYILVIFIEVIIILFICFIIKIFKKVKNKIEKQRNINYL